VKLLFDENLSFRLVAGLADVYPLSAHVRDVGLQGLDDGTIWRYAAEHGYVLVSKDTDFFQRSVAHGVPPKVIWLRIGNASTKSISSMLRTRFIIIRRFVDDPDASFLPLRAAEPGVTADAEPE
jgi:predicted nuclease of predicted toxin-antitoxin system